MERRDRAKNTTAKRKLMSRWITGLWVGMVERTGEHIIVSETIGKASRVRSIKRVPESVRWSKDQVLNMKATPRFPDPNLREQQDIEVPIDAAEHGVAAAARGSEDRRVEMPQAATSAPRDDDIRELRITQRMLEKFGFSQSCECCARLQRGDPR